MKLSKKKVFALALAVCLLATLSLGSLAWFTAEDSVNNDFMIAGSKDGDKDDIFSVDVWEDGDEEGDGLVYEDILPGDTLSKVAHVKNTGSYEQYIRVKITVSQASIWQDVYKANMIPVTEFVNVDLSKVYESKVGSYLEGDNFVYYLYYNDILPVDGDITVFTEAYIDNALNREQAAAMKGGFQITVTADAVQTENVGDDVYEAFNTVGMLNETNEVNTIEAGTYDELKAALENNVRYIVLTNSIKCLNEGRKLAGTTAELYMNGCTLTTAPGSDEYGFAMTGDLTLSGFGTLTVRTSNMQVKGTLTVHDGVTIDGQGRIEDAYGVRISLD